jgi:DNA-binding NarL/FixJ family response regulator
VPAIRVLIADDHHLFLDGVVSLLKTEKDFDLDTACDGYEALDKIKQKDFDVCLLDIGMPGLDGMATAKVMKTTKPVIRIIILSTYNDKEIITNMIKAGVDGYLLKNCTKQELTDAIHAAHAGEKCFSIDVKNSIVNQFTTYLAQEKGTQETILTPREVEIVKLLARGYTNEKIADQLSISYRTVETHRKNIMQKTHSHNLAGLLKFVYDSKLI